jgi:hypothetical protein
MTKSATRVAADKVTFTQTEVTSAVALKAPIASPSFTGSSSTFDSVSGDLSLYLTTGHVADKNEIVFGDGSVNVAQMGVGGTSGDIITGSTGQDFNIRTGGGGRAINFSTDNGASTAMKIDDGRVTKPLQPAFRVSNGGAADYTTIGYMTFGNAMLNTGTHYSTSTGKFTAPIAGRYYLAFRALTRSVAASNMWVGINVNGTALTQTYHTHTNHSNISAESIVSLSANDYVQVYLGGGGIHSGGGHDHYTFFQGYLLG